ncbi:MAG TPA: S8 family peptidase [Gemmatimonadaceae bacterium]|nr:S8 family peptidase [Gemmatimonadaceae bacterium]
MKRRLVVVLSALLAAACAEPTSGPAPTPLPSLTPVDQAPLFLKGADGIAGRYIVVFRDEVADPHGRAREKALKANGKLEYSYSSALKGFAAELTDEAVSELRADPDVAYIEQDQAITLTATQSPAPSWGLDRIDQRNLPLSNSYTYNATPAQQTNVRAYIIDTGIQTGHADFGGRASAVFDAFGGSGQDCHGHGTHVAGTVGGTTYGVAKSIKLRAVRVLNCSGSGTNSGVIAGMDWVRTNHIKPAVANMSLGGGFSSAVNTAANNLASAGVFLAVAAGNSNANACNSSPSSAANATSVAASSISDARASFSNFGSCVHIYAPGVSIKSDWLNGGTNTISGTSMATPHVTGVAALYKAVNGDASFSAIRSWLINNATLNVITGNPAGTPNRLLFKSTF